MQMTRKWKFKQKGNAGIEKFNALWGGRIWRLAWPNLFCFCSGILDFQLRRRECVVLHHSSRVFHFYTIRGTLTNQTVSDVHNLFHSSGLSQQESFRSTLRTRSKNRWHHSVELRESIEKQVISHDKMPSYKTWMTWLEFVCLIQLWRIIGRNATMQCRFISPAKATMMNGKPTIIHIPGRRYPFRSSTQ